MPAQRRRREAHGKAAEILSSGRPISDADVLAVLSLWRFRKNTSRLNVLPRGTDFVSSDTLGLVCDRKGNVLVDSGTRKWPSVLRLLATWLKDRKPAALEMDFPFTSISVNHNYSARLHRDGHNAGVFCIVTETTASKSESLSAVYTMFDQSRFGAPVTIPSLHTVGSRRFLDEELRGL